ncbi:hypothetical protein GCM10017083_46860 [Thalassobaculum fulvum]|uniref:Permease n=1 Tax=Thalassobaculum fulvum TaxID=1633335 RepID=A0A918XWP2_9PROT|nr:permease [Thalassobaculum fulvum]GHD60663.1 hypothetical protein GCM10017083_46860 [Thalassobaculum fulvum]
MAVSEVTRSSKLAVRHVYLLLGLLLVPTVWWQPQLAWQTVAFVTASMLHVAPIVVPGVLLAAWITASGAGERVSSLFRGRTVPAVLATAFVGALLPVCGVTVLPLMAGLLAAGVPLAPVMAFWLASPITGPAILAATVATLGWKFAVGKALAAIGLGLLGGGVTGMLARRDWIRAPLRSNRIVGTLGRPAGTCGGAAATFDARIWRERARRSRFGREAWSITRLMLIVLIPAFAAEFLLNAWLRPDALGPLLGRDSALAIPLAVVVGGPAYVDGYAALPLTRTLIDHGMSTGAAMAFLVSGGVVSVWGALAILPVLRLKPFLLYLALAAAGSMASGWLFGLLS